MQIDSIFKDLVVVELACALAGPSVGMFFAELGAKVIKVENKTTNGDVTRRWKHPTEDPNDPYSAYYHCVNWGKKSLMLNLKDDDGRDEVYHLIKSADVVISNFKFGSAVKLGMDYEKLKELNPQLIYGNVYAYDEDDPRPGFDALMQAETGWMSMNGQSHAPPTKVPLPIIDILAGHQLKQGVLVALMERAKTGKGCKVSVSLYDASLAAMTNQATTLLNLGITPTRTGSEHPSIAPYGDVVTTADDVDFLLAVGTQEQFDSLCDALGSKNLKIDDRFRSNKSRLDHRPLLTQLLQQSVVKLSALEFEENCNREGVPIGPIRDLSEVFEDEDAKELILEEKLYTGASTYRVKSVVFKMKS